MKTKTYSKSTGFTSGVETIVDDVYREYGEKVVNISVAGKSGDNYVVFYTICYDEPKKQTNID